MEQELNIKEEVQDYDCEPNEELEDRKLIIPKIKREVDTFEDDIVDEEYEEEEPYDEQDLEESSDEYSENDSDSDYKESCAHKQGKFLRSRASDVSYFLSTCSSCLDLLISSIMVNRKVK